MVRYHLGGTRFPDVLAAIHGFVDRVSSLSDDVLAIFEGAIEGFANWIDGIDLTGPLQAARHVLDWLGDQLDTLLAWADDYIRGLIDAGTRLFHAFVDFVEPIVDVFVRLPTFVVNPFLLPAAIGAALWQMLPDGLREPIIDFVLEVLILAIELAPSSRFAGGPLAVFMQSMSQGFLREVQGFETDEKIEASNRVAFILGGGNLEFAAGYVAGVFKGVIEGITFPFIMLGMLAELAVRGLAWVSAGMAEVLGVARESTTDTEKDGESTGGGASADEAFDWTVTEALFDEVSAESRRAQGLDREAEDKKSESTDESHPSPLGFLVDFFRGLAWIIHDLSTAAHQPQNPFISLLDDAAASPAGLNVGLLTLILPRYDTHE